MPDFLTLTEASDYLDIPENTLRHYRQRGIGPLSFKYAGKITFDRVDLDAWVVAQRAATTRGEQ